MRLDPIKIVAYDPSWPAAFERERARVDRPAYRAGKAPFIEATLGLHGTGK